MNPRHRTGGLIAILLVCFGASLLLTPPGSRVHSASSGDWSQPTNLSGWQDDIATSFRLKQGENGTLAAFWVRINTAGDYSLWASVRSAAGVWGRAENLSGWIQPVSSPLGYFVIPWQAEISPQGTAWAVWVEDTSTPGTNSVWVRAAYKTPNQPWQRDDPSVGYDSYVQSLDLVFSPQGQGLVVWADCTTDPANSGFCLVRARRRAAQAEAWGVLEGLDDATVGSSIQVVQALAGPDGNFVVLWDESAPATTQSALWSRAFNNPPGAWDPSPTNVSGMRESFYQTQAVIDPAGTVTAGFLALSSPGKQSNYAVTRNAGNGTWSLPVTISLESAFLGGPRFAVGQGGDVTAAWAQANDTMTAWTIYANSRAAGGVWAGMPQQITPWGVSVSDPYLGVWPNGGTLVVWSQIDGSQPANQDEAVFYSVRPPGGNWGAGGEGQLSGWYDDIFFNMDLDVALDGSAALMWSVSDATQPAGQQQAAFNALWPPGGSWQAPEQLSEWQTQVWVERQDGQVLGREGSPLAAVWRAYRLETPETAVFVRTEGLSERQVLVPLVLRPSGD